MCTKLAWTQLIILTKPLALALCSEAHLNPFTVANIPPRCGHSKEWAGLRRPLAVRSTREVVLASANGRCEHGTG